MSNPARQETLHPGGRRPLRFARTRTTLQLWMVGALVLVVPVGPSLAACPSCATSPCTISGTNTIGSGETCNYSGKSVIVTGKLLGDNNASCYSVVADNLTVRGTLRARSSCINVDVTGNFKMEVVSTSDANVDVSLANSANDGFFVTCGSATLNGKAIDADSDATVAGYGSAGDVSIVCSGSITGTAQSIHAVGTGGDSGGDITIQSTTGSIDLGTAFDGSGNGTAANGGLLTFSAASNVTLGTSSRSLQSQATGTDAIGGDLSITSNGTVTINGAINVNGNSAYAAGGTIGIVANSVATGTSWSARGDSNGDGGGIFVDALAGAGTVTTTVGNALWDVTADGDGFGGSIEIQAIGDLTFAGDMDAGGNGLNSFSGEIDIRTTGDISVASTSRIEADATGVGSSDGSIYLEGCDITLAGVVDTRDADVSGKNTFVYGGFFTQSSSANMMADDQFGNTVACRCVDTLPADGVCDSATCIHNPVLNGSATPTSTHVLPVSIPACS